MTKEDKNERDKDNVSMYSDESGRPHTQKKVTPSSSRWTSGIELLVKKASADTDFRMALLSDPLLAAESTAVQLTEAESTMLRSIAPNYLDAVIEITSRFGFEKALRAQTLVSTGNRPD